MTTLLTVAVLSLMLPLRLETSFVLLRPFEVLVVLGLYGLPLLAKAEGLRVPHGFLLLLPYLLWHVVSAAAGGGLNVAREAGQVVLVVAFALLLSQVVGRLEPKAVLRRLLWGATVIACGTIVWHVSQGYFVGWKRIPDPRLAFIAIPMILAGLLLFTPSDHLPRLRMAWFAVFPVLLLSGERKALIIYLVLSALLLAKGRLALIAPVLATSFVALVLLSTTITNPYLQKQLNTLVNPGGTGNYNYVLATGQYAPGDTPSNVQRAFALNVSRRIVQEHPFIGVGTNQYVAELDAIYSDLPPEIRLGIHGEFQRVLTENGALGLILYLGVWAASYMRLLRLLSDAARRGRITAKQRRVFPLLIMLPLALFLGTEAPGTRAFVSIIIISLLPEMVKAALSRPAQVAAAPASQPATQPAVCVPGKGTA